MSRISDELVEWCNGVDVDGDACDTPRVIAERIDKEMVELPLSADGYIWTGREECFWTSAEQEGYHSFGCIALRNGKWHVEDIDGMDYEAESVWYERPDSLERIADELDDWKRKAAEKIPGFGLEEDALHSLADRIRKLAKERGEHE